MKSTSLRDQACGLETSVHLAFLRRQLVQHVNQNWKFLKGREEHTRSVIKCAQSRARPHHVEQQDMSMIFRAACWVLECASREDGDHQQQIALVVVTLPGAGRAGTARELKAPQYPNANAESSPPPKKSEGSGRNFRPREGAERAARGHGKRRRPMGSQAQKETTMALLYNETAARRRRTP